MVSWLVSALFLRRNAKESGNTELFLVSLLVSFVLLGELDSLAEEAETKGRGAAGIADCHELWDFLGNNEILVSFFLTQAFRERAGGAAAQESGRSQDGRCEQHVSCEQVELSPCQGTRHRFSLGTAGGDLRGCNHPSVFLGNCARCSSSPRDAYRGTAQ